MSADTRTIRRTIGFAGGKSFQQAAPSSREVMRLLTESPLPWTAEMLKIWMGWARKGGSQLSILRNTGRVLPLGRGLYTAAPWWRE